MILPMQIQHLMIGLFFLAASSLLLSCDKSFGDTRPEGRLVQPTVTEDSSLPSITVNGVQLHAEAYGHPDSALLVVIHGGPGSDYRYLLNCKAFADHGFRVVFYDQRGAGLSERFPKSHYSTVEILSDELHGVIAHYRTHADQKVFLLGHSWGAMLAAIYLNDRPNAPIDGLVLGEPGGFKWDDISGYLNRSQDFKLFSESLNDAIYADQILSGKDDEHEILDYKLDLLTSVGDSQDSPVGNEDFLPKWRSGAITSMAYSELGPRIKPDWTPNLHLYNTKILFLYSENNKAYGRAHAEHVSSAFPKVELFETKDAGHDMLSFPRGWNNSFPVMLNYLNSLK